MQWFLPFGDKAMNRMRCNSWQGPILSTETSVYGGENLVWDVLRALRRNANLLLVSTKLFQDSQNVAKQTIIWKQPGPLRVRRHSVKTGLHYFQGYENRAVLATSAIPSTSKNLSWGTFFEVAPGNYCCDFQIPERSPGSTSESLH